MERACSWLWVFVLLAFWSRSASAESAEQAAAARVLFDEGRSLAAEGRHGEACPKFEESLRLDFGIGTQFNLADCWEQTGRTASAWALFLEVARAAREGGQLDREAVANERAASVAQRLSKLVIRVSAAAKGIRVSRDGVVLGEAVWGVAVPVDPGTYTVEAHAPGRSTWSASVSVPELAGETVVTVPELASLERAAGTAPNDEARLTEDSATSSSGGHSALLVSGIATGVMAAGTAVTGVLYSTRKSDYDTANGSGEPSRFEKKEAAHDMGVANLAFAGATVVGAGVTVALWLLSDTTSSAEASSKEPSLGLTLNPTTSGVTFQGVFD